MAASKGTEEATLRQVNVRLSPIAERQLRDLATKCGESQSEIIRKAIAMFWVLEHPDRIEKAGRAVKASTGR